MSTAIALGFAPKQSLRDCLNEVVSAQWQMNSGAVCYKCESNPNQAVSQCMMGNFVKLREIAGIVLLMAPKMNRGLTWSWEEVKCLIKIWSDEHIAEQLSKTAKCIKHLTKA